MSTEEQILEQLQDIAGSLQRLAPKKAEVDWSGLAYQWLNHEDLRTVKSIDPIRLTDLLHIDKQKSQLVENTKKFIQGKPANDALLWGARGTGKSSLIKALLNEYGDQGLRVIEVDKDALIHFSELTRMLENRSEYFILFCDDLSFESQDASYKALKAALDGSVAARPRNVLVYATSNRRHLLPESMQDNQDTKLVETELHHSDAVEEKISLAERFGLWLSFHPLNKVEYLTIVNHWVDHYNVEIKSNEELSVAAMRFSIHRGSRSGRVAHQFVKTLIKA